ncbi:flavodoxin family protein [bacterium]|nr:flavodoxin family protein [bacterium]
MPKRVLIISSSPRERGNSEILCEEFKRGAEDAGHYVEIIKLRDKKINNCIGCGLCNANDHTSCFQKDDMEEITEKMIGADLIVLATPVYFYAMCSQMKALIDRCCAGYTRISNKRFYLIATAQDPREEALEITFMGFNGFLENLENAIEIGRLYGVGLWNKGDIYNYPKLMEEAYSIAKHI